MTDKLKNECIKFYKKYNKSGFYGDVDFNSPNWIKPFKKILKQVDCNSWGLLKDNSFSELFLETFISVFNTVDILKHQKLSEKFIIKLISRRDNYAKSAKLNGVACQQKLSDKFIKKYKNNFNWYYVCKFQKLSESLMEECFHLLDIATVIKYQQLSESFIEKHLDTIKDNRYFRRIAVYQIVSKNFLNKIGLSELKNNWNYHTLQQKVNYIKENTDYKILKDKNGPYIIAWKGIRKDRYSKYNFQYRYLKGKTYTCHCDATAEENSFGLSAWTKENAKDYCDQLLIQVKIYVNDIGRIVHDSKKIRCKKFTVLT